MNMIQVSAVLADAAAIPQGNQNGMRISLPGVISHAHRALLEMAAPLEDVSRDAEERFSERVEDTQPALHAHGLEVLQKHLDLLGKAIQEGDAKTVRQFFDLYVFD
jgi:soluble cytochrome b562